MMDKKNKLGFVKRTKFVVSHAKGMLDSFQINRISFGKRLG